MIHASRLADLTESLQAAGIPCQGVDQDGNVDFLQTTTNEQRQQAAAIVAGFDGRPRKKRPLPAMLEDIKALNGNQQRDLQLAMMASYLRDHPRLARKLGIPLDGDEPDGE